ncbi:MAG: hypothetical protein JXR48_00160 [Candidatus Delongbacteria bacterium]|nr:hypothetical protein [Candidatus Delongbacteria bacterium]MBN2833356.1 hypothetical protein [Candidatus Delongbacteria bacterium]
MSKHEEELNKSIEYIKTNKDINPDYCISIIDDSIETCKIINNKEKLSSFYGYRAYILGNKQDYKNAILNLKNSINILKQIEIENKKIRIANLFNNLGILYTKLYMIDESIKSYEIARKYYIEADNGIGIVSVLTNLGVLYEQMNYLEKGYEMFKQALFMSFDKGLEVNGTLYANLANSLVYIDNSEMDLADEYFQKALEVFNSSDDAKHIYDKITALQNYSIFLSKRNDFINSLKMIDESIKLSDFVNNRYEKFKSLMIKFELFTAMNRLNSAEDLLSWLDEEISYIDDLQLKIEYKSRIYNFYKVKGDFKKALEILEEQILLKDKYVNHKRDLAFIAMENRNEITNEKEKNEILYAKNNELKKNNN